MNKIIMKPLPRLYLKLLHRSYHIQALGWLLGWKKLRRESEMLLLLDSLANSNTRNVLQSHFQCCFPEKCWGFLQANRVTKLICQFSQRSFVSSYISNGVVISKPCMIRSFLNAWINFSNGIFNLRQTWYFILELCITKYNVSEKWCWLFPIFISWFL